MYKILSLYFLSTLRIITKILQFEMLRHRHYHHRQPFCLKKLLFYTPAYNTQNSQRIFEMGGLHFFFLKNMNWLVYGDNIRIHKCTNAERKIYKRRKTSK